MRGPRAAVAAALAIVSFVVLPAGAGAATIEVDSVADEPAAAPGLCLTLGEACTLRAAIEASNSTPAEDDVISFDETVFTGQLADTIAALEPLPAIVDKVHIEGKRCATEAGVTGPCQAISGSGLVIEGVDGVEIDGLAVRGIRIAGGSEEATIQGSWFGLALDGGAIAIGTGVAVEPDSNRAQIGGEQTGEGNLFIHAVKGLYILGASETTVQGNSFGVDLDNTELMLNEVDIAVASDPVSETEAIGTLIGVEPGSEAAATRPCDKGCNVIAGASDSAIELSAPGMSPPVDTHIAGNFIGIAANYTVLGNGYAGVHAGKAENTLIGGSEESEANYFASSWYAVFDEGGSNLEVIGNKIGYDSRDRRIAGPYEAGILCAPSGVSGSPRIEGNAINLGDTVLTPHAGIEVDGPGALIVDNTISASFYGIRTINDSSPLGSTIAGNTIKASESNGILIENDLNQIRGNAVLGSGAAGIRIQSPDGLLPVTGNLIGGDNAADENLISNSVGAAIEIADLDETDNEVARNHGTANSDSFIDLVPLEGEALGPNRGIKPPSFTTATESGASGGGAKAGATVRVFRKANASAGEVASFLGEAQADAGGNWKVAFLGTVPGGTIVAATQTSAGATSELIQATTVATIKPGGGGAVAGGGAGSPAVDQTPPRVTIVKAPKAKSTSTTAKFKFSADEAGATFQCKLDRQAFSSCGSPKKYKKLKPGKHVFEVRAVDVAGNVGAVVKRKFTVLD